MTWVLLTWPIHLRHRHDSCLVSRDHLSVLPLMLLLLLPFLILPFLFLPESLFLSNTFVNTLQHMSAHTYTHPLPLPLSFPLPLSLPASFFIMHFLKWAKYGAGAKHQAMMMWKLTSFRGVRRLVGESKAKQHDLITDPTLFSMCHAWFSPELQFFFLYSCGVLEIALSHFRLLCSLPGCPVDSCLVT